MALNKERQVIAANVVNCSGADTKSPLPKDIQVLVTTFSIGENAVPCPYAKSVQYPNGEVSTYCLAGRQNPRTALTDVLNALPVNLVMNSARQGQAINVIDGIFPRCYLKDEFN